MLRGVKIITGTLSMFDKVASKLEKGVEVCEKEIVVRDETINKAAGEKASLDSSKGRAKKAIDNLKSFTV